MNGDQFLALCASMQQPLVSGSNPFRVRCRNEAAADAAVIRDASAELGGLPAALLELWAYSAEATLFEDVDYGQWGLHLLAPRDVVDRTELEQAHRPVDFQARDIVVGEFLGDLDLVVIDSTGNVLIAMPLDPRETWPVVGGSLWSFLETYIAGVGDKFWESR